MELNAVTVDEYDVGEIIAVAIVAQRYVTRLSNISMMKWRCGIPQEPGGFVNLNEEMKDEEVGKIIEVRREFFERAPLDVFHDVPRRICLGLLNFRNMEHFGE
jgi:hypothetical protein